jgi:hypothetical protein
MPHALLKPLSMSVCCLSILMFALQGQATPLGNPFMVNTATAGNQTPTHFSAGTNGEKVLIWSDAAANATYVQRVRSSGIPFLTKHQIQAPDYSKLSVDRAGNFSLAAASGNVLVYDRNGNLLSNFRPTPDSWNSVASMDTDGNVTVGYARPNVTGSPQTIAMRRFNTGGIPISPETLVTPEASGKLDSPISIATDNAGNTALVWRSSLAAAVDKMELRTQRFSRAGIALTPILLVSHASPSSISGGRIAMEPGGKSVIAWSSSTDQNYTWNVYARRFDANGNPLAVPIRVNQRLLEGGPGENLGIVESGDFVVSWIASNGVVGGSPDSTLAARQYRADGTPIGNEFRLDPPQPRFASRPLLAMDLVGNFAVTWLSTSAETGWDVMVRPFKMDNRPPITQLVSNRPAQGLAGDTDSWNYYRLTVPAGVAQMNINMTGPVGGGDGDMYIRLGAFPSLTAWDYRPYVNGSNEAIALSNPLPGDYYIAIHGRSAYSSIGLTASYD